LIARYFATEQAAIEELEAEAAALAQKLEELKEEHGGEEGLLEAVVDEKGDIARAAVLERLLETKGDAEVEDERRLLTDCLDLLERESAANKRAKDAQKELEGKSLRSTAS